MENFPKPILIVRVPIYEVDEIKKIQYIEDMISSLDNLKDDYYVIVVPVPLCEEKVNFELLSVKNITKVEIDKLQEFIFEKIG